MRKRMTEGPLGILPDHLKHAFDVSMGKKSNSPVDLNITYVSADPIPTTGVHSNLRTDEKTEKFEKQSQAPMKVDDLVQAFTQDFIVNDERPYEEL